MMRLGGLREPISAVVKTLDAGVVVPLVHRERLVGLLAAAAPKDRALRDRERDLLRQVSGAVARALTFIALFREAAARVEVAREVEVAAAVQEGRATGEGRVRFDRCELLSYYQPAAQFGGDWWTSYELPDGRVLVAIGDVTGHGMSAALISSTVEGACETAQRMLGASFEVLALLELLNQMVLDVGRGDFSMSCFAAVIDADAGQVSFANAGHAFPYVVRRGRNGDDGRAELRSLVSRGTLLGTPAPRLVASSFELEPDDAIVFYSDSLVDSRSPTGEPYGERRFQRLLRRHVHAAGARACEVIMGDANAHYGEQPILDDITLVVVRLGASVA
jgi:phosphoserine phosphatase RsbU/P